MYSRCSWLGEFVASLCGVVCERLNMGGVVCRGDCGVCGRKVRCRDCNLRTYCHVSPILFVVVFGSRPYMFLHFCEMLFFRGFFWGRGLFWDSTCSFIVFL